MIYFKHFDIIRLGDIMDRNKNKKELKLKSNMTIGINNAIVGIFILVIYILYIFKVGFKEYALTILPFLFISFAMILKGLTIIKEAANYKELLEDNKKNDVEKIERENRILTTIRSICNYVALIAVVVFIVLVAYLK